MKKTYTFLLTSALLLGAVAPAMADEQPTTSEVEQVQENFMKLTGKITSIEKHSDDSIHVWIEQGDDTFTMVITEQTKVLDNTGAISNLAKGTSFTAYVSTNKPMFMIYPPRYSPELVIVETEQMGSVTVDVFDKNYTAKDLKLNLSDQTVLEDLAGNSLTALDIINQDIAVFYSATTRSIPAQTSPSKIILLTNPQQDIENITMTDFYEQNGVTMVPLRLIAEKLGWAVTSTGKGATLTKGNASYTITRGEKQYDFNRSVRTFEEAPALLEKDKTYVPISFVEQLQQ